MTDSYPTPSSSGVDVAKEQAGDLKDTVTAEAGNVAGTAKEQAANVAGEAKSQARDLLRQTQRELREQAATQQQRVASGLHTVSGQLGDMASSAEPGVASDVVRQVADRAGGVATWLDGRDPGSLLTELTSFARRRPGLFIGGAVVAGVLVGRLTRALASGAKDDAASERSASHATDPAEPVAATPASAPASPVVVPGTATGYQPPTTDDSETPLFTERVKNSGTDPAGTRDDVRDDIRGGQGL